MSCEEDCTSWNQDLDKLRETLGDTTQLTVCSNGDMNEKFDHDLGCLNGCHFTAWSDKYVYFPGGYDGQEWVAYVPRNPCEVATKHVGG